MPRFFAEMLRVVGELFFFKLAIFSVLDDWRIQHLLRNKGAVSEEEEKTLYQGTANAGKKKERASLAV